MEIMAVPVLSDQLFGEFRTIIQRETGIVMRESKKLLVSNRVKKRMRQTRTQSFQQYYELLKRDMAAELPRFIDAVTTNETYFYRGESHFAALRRVVLPELYARKGCVTVWSVGCSTGEEAYTLAIEALDASASRRDRGIEVMATDISTSVIDQASTGLYTGRTLRFLPQAIRERYFEETTRGTCRVKDEVRQHVRFSVHNILRDALPVRPVDVIFCRNVMIYFDTTTQMHLVDERLARALAPEGYLFIGHSESLIGKSRKFYYTRIDHAPVYRPMAVKEAP